MAKWHPCGGRRFPADYGGDEGQHGDGTTGIARETYDDREHVGGAEEPEDSVWRAGWGGSVGGRGKADGIWNGGGDGELEEAEVRSRAATTRWRGRVKEREAGSPRFALRTFIASSTASVWERIAHAATL
jgi:hypothetical protein